MEKACTPFSRLREQGRLAWGELSVIKQLFVPICILTALYALGISAILMANFNYIDDLERVVKGFQGWDNFSRYLDNFLSTFIHTNDYLTDISPLPQLIATAELAVASAVVLHVVTGKTRFTFWEYAAVLPLGLSPYYLECLSFKFDAPYMALSVLAAVLPFLFAADMRRFAVAVFLGSFVLCNTYQVSAGILPMFTVLLAIRYWSAGRSWREVLVFIAVAAVSYCASLLLFQLLLVHPSRMSHVSTSIAPLPQLIPNALGLYHTYFSNILSDFDSTWLILMALIGLAFVVFSVRDTLPPRRVAAFFLALVSLVLLALLSFGVYPLLAKPLIRARSMYGCGAAIAFAAVPVASARKALPAKLVTAALAWCFFVFAFTYGNALSDQKDYTDFRIREVIDAVKTTDAVLAETPYIAAQIDGDIGFAPVLDRTMKHYPILKRLVPHTFSGSSRPSRMYQLAYFYGLPDMVWDMRGDMANMPLPVLDETMYHTLRGNEHFLHIILK